MSETEHREMTPNQVVAYNLQRARRLRGWTQEEATRRLEPHLGTKWSKVNLSGAERSMSPTARPRRFDADDLIAFSLAFDLPPTWFFVPPTHVERVVPTRAAQESLDAGDLLDLLFFRGWTDLDQRLSEMPPERRGDARRRQGELVEQYMREALGDLRDIEERFAEMQVLAGDLMVRFSDARARVHERLRKAFTNEEEI